jgi:hypothetical protein
MMKILNMLLVIAIFTGCHTAKVNVRDNDNASAWLNRYNTEGRYPLLFDEENLPVVVIPDNYKAEYIARLESGQYIELTAEEYSLLTGRFLKKKHGLAVRAVYTQIYGHFFATQSEDYGIFVYYGYMGSGYDQLNKTVIILETDMLPKEIYVSFTSTP